MYKLTLACLIGAASSLKIKDTEPFYADQCDDCGVDPCLDTKDDFWAWATCTGTAKKEEYDTWWGCYMGRNICCFTNDCEERPAPEPVVNECECGVDPCLEENLDLWAW